MKSWPVSRKPSSCPEASEGPNPSPQSPESEPCVLRVQRCPTAPSKLCQLRRLCRHHAQDGECRGWALLAPEALADLCSPLMMAWGVGQPPAPLGMPRPQPRPGVGRGGSGDLVCRALVWGWGVRWSRTRSVDWAGLACFSDSSSLRLGCFLGAQVLLLSLTGRGSGEEDWCREHVPQSRNWTFWARLPLSRRGPGNREARRREMLRVDPPHRDSSFP